MRGLPPIILDIVRKNNGKTLWSIDGRAIPHWKNLPCQDAFYINDLSDSIVVAAVCDGLGSCKKSEIGSSIAAKILVEYCSEHYKSCLSFDEVKKIMNNSFVYAYKNIIEKAENENEKLMSMT